ncbi:hypothetical protein VPH35_135006 [Triticum aestivum]|uniref:uncharacterized protein n=1 Tax=Triticum aestivum TaxID=4565 RepID=UPI001D02017D|nr:uncharacterized protein LOC123170775 [Triticum aestivum]
MRQQFTSSNPGGAFKPLRCAVVRELLSPATGSRRRPARIASPSPGRGAGIQAFISDERLPAFGRSSSSPEIRPHVPRPSSPRTCRSAPELADPGYRSHGRSLMENSTSDQFVNGSCHRSRQNDNNGTDCSGESHGDPMRKLHQLVKEHGALCRAFLHEASSSATAMHHQQQSEHLVRKLGSIWYHPEWAARVQDLQCLFSYSEFRHDVLEIVEFFEKELGKCRDELQTGQAISYSALTNLLPLIVPLVLKLLRAVHALWISYAEDAMANLPEELVETARIMQNPAQISRLLIEIGEL